MKSNILDIIIDTILSDRINWRRTWNPQEQAQNYVSKKTYRGANSYLNLVGTHFITFKQAQALGATIKKGAKGYPVVYALFKESEENQTDRDFLGHRYYMVFDIKDTIGLPPPETITPKDTITPLDVLTSYLARENIEIKPGNPAYNITRDHITMPRPEDFESSGAYNATLAHECIHSTGAPARTNRHNLKDNGFTDHRFGSNSYAKEELVAELGAMFLTGNTLDKNHIAYLQSWIRALASQDKKQEIYQAFQFAQKAIDYINPKATTNDQE